MTEFEILQYLKTARDSREALRSLTAGFLTWSEPLRQVFRLKWLYSHCCDDIQSFATHPSAPKLRAELKAAIEFFPNL